MDNRAKVYDDSRDKGMSHEEAVQVAEAHHRTQQNLANKPARVNDFKRDVTLLDKVGAGAQAFSDAATFGLSGIVDDALSGGSFAENRAFRKQNKAALPATARLGAEVAGSLATPLAGVKAAIAAARAGKGLAGVRAANQAAGAGGSIISQAPRLAGRGERMLRSTGDAALQAGASGAAENLDDASASGLLKAGVKGVTTGLLGGGTAAGIGGVAGGVARTASRVRDVKHLDETLFGIKGVMNKADAANYPLAEGTMRMTKGLQAVMLKDPVVAPIAKEVIDEMAYQGVKLDAPKVVTAVYRRLSAQQRRAQLALDNAKAGLGGYDPKLSEGTLENLAKAKERIYTAANPEFRQAVDVHRVHAGQLKAAQTGADVGGKIVKGTSIAAPKVFSQSREALLQKIRNTNSPMTVEEMEAMRAGLLARAGEQIHLSGNPLGGFGLIASAARAPLAAHRAGPVLRELEARTGRGRLGEKASTRVRGVLARQFGRGSGE